MSWEDILKLKERTLKGMKRAFAEEMRSPVFEIHLDDKREIEMLRNKAKETINLLEDYYEGRKNYKAEDIDRVFEQFEKFMDRISYIRSIS